MWVKLQEDPPYLLLNRQINNHEVYVTDYITIWYVYFNENEFLERLLDSNYGLEVDHDELIQNGANFLKNPTDLRKLNIVKGVSTLDISMTKLFEYPLQLKLKLAEGSKEMFFQNVTHMLLKTVADLQASQQELRSLLKKKDEEIEEYKCEGKEIALRYLKTKQFNDEEHMKKHEVHKECADLVNIPERVLDKVVLSTSRNESMSRFYADAIRCLKQTVQFYTGRRSAIFACFLNLERNCDQVPYDNLWNELRSKPSIPHDIVVMFDFFYKNELNTKGLPRLINPYLYGLSDKLTNANIGCFIGGTFINHISYADNLVLLAPSIRALRLLVVKCEDYAFAKELRFNVNTSKLLAFQSPRGPKHRIVLPVYLHGLKLDRVFRYKYLDHWLSEYLSDDDEFSDMDSDEFSNGEYIPESDD